MVYLDYDEALVFEEHVKNVEPLPIKVLEEIRKYHIDIVL